MNTLKSEIAAGSRTYPLSRRLPDEVGLAEREHDRSGPPGGGPAFCLGSLTASREVAPARLPEPGVELRGELRRKRLRGVRHAGRDDDVKDVGPSAICSSTPETGAMFDAL